jgi:hypothetical protein
MINRKRVYLDRRTVGIALHTLQKSANDGSVSSLPFLTGNACPGSDATHEDWIYDFAVPAATGCVSP